MNLDGVKVEWVKDRLNEFLEQTRPAFFQSGNQMRPFCGRATAIELAEVVRQIFWKLYPEWRSENPFDWRDEFKSERDAAVRLLARIDTYEEVESALGKDSSPRITAASLHPLIWTAAQAQWSTRHRHEAVFAAAKAINSYLQTKVSRRDVSEGDLVRQAFSDKPPEPNRPRLRFGSIADEQTSESMRQGVMNFGAGCFGAIRNPVGHLPNDEVELDEQAALERLAALSLFARWIDEADLEEVFYVGD